MTLLDRWSLTYIRGNMAPLFDAEGLVVKTDTFRTLKIVKRHPKFDELMINTVEKGVTDDSWEGIIYIMYWIVGGKITPLYIGKTERQGGRHPISTNIKDIRNNQGHFGRWGYAPEYLIGDLSLALFGEGEQQNRNKKAARWVERLFERPNPPILFRPVYVALISWYQGMQGPSGRTGEITAIRQELLELAKQEYPDTLLNGR